MQIVSSYYNWPIIYVTSSLIGADNNTDRLGWFYSV